MFVRNNTVCVEGLVSTWLALSRKWHQRSGKRLNSDVLITQWSPRYMVHRCWRRVQFAELENVQENSKFCHVSIQKT